MVLHTGTSASTRIGTIASTSENKNVYGILNTPVKLCVCAFKLVSWPSLGSNSRSAMLCERLRHTAKWLLKLSVWWVPSMLLKRCIVHNSMHLDRHEETSVISRYWISLRVYKPPLRRSMLERSSYILGTRQVQVIYTRQARRSWVWSCSWELTTSKIASKR